MRGSKSTICGVCSDRKVKRRARLVCLRCARRYAKEARIRNGKPFTITESGRRAKARYRNKVRPSGLTNQKVYSLRKRYGISEGDYLRLFQKQRGLCAICRSDIAADDCCVDHCHDTKAVRGLLCRQCNFGVGQFQDNPDLLLSAAKYLKAKQ